MPTRWNEVFKPDSGIVFEIRVYGLTAKDYDVLLPLLIERYPSVYSEDGGTKELPDYDTITRRRNLVTTMLELRKVRRIRQIRGPVLFHLHPPLLGHQTWPSEASKLSADSLEKVFDYVQYRKLPRQIRPAPNAFSSVVTRRSLLAARRVRKVWLQECTCRGVPKCH